MSKQFESKKEAVSLINKSHAAEPVVTSWQNKYNTLKDKFDTITKRTKNLERVYNFHKGIVQNISSGIVTIDYHGNITFVNKAALKVINYNFDELINTPIKKLFADSFEADEILKELLDKKHMFESKEINLISGAKKIIPIGFTTTHLRATEEKYEGVIFIFRDLTNIRNFRLQMERMDRLATLGEVSAGIAHEIRNPLAGIKTSAQVLEESFGPGDFRAQLVSRIVKEIDRSNELLRKFFNFAKPGKPQQNFVSIEMIIDGVYLLLAPRMRKKNIEFKAQFMPDPHDVYIDENQIEQVLINLFLNAIDGIEKNGKLTISTSLIENNKKHGGEFEQDMIRVDVEDTGTGIESENLEKIFNPFFTTKSDGVGLGLSISSRLVEENGGKLELHSKVGKGTCFSLYLPTK